MLLTALLGLGGAIALGGCQSTGSAPPPSDHTVHAHHAGLAHTAVVRHGDGRVHVLLAREVDLPVDVRSNHVSLGAGDELGKQMFERYASLVRAQQRPDDREFAAVPESQPAEALEQTPLQLAAQAWYGRGHKSRGE